MKKFAILFLVWASLVYTAAYAPAPWSYIAVYTIIAGTVFLGGLYSAGGWDGLLTWYIWRQEQRVAAKLAREQEEQERKTRKKRVSLRPIVVRKPKREKPALPSWWDSVDDDEITF